MVERPTYFGDQLLLVTATQLARILYLFYVNEKTLYNKLTVEM